MSTLGHAPRVIGVYRRSDLPVGERDVVLALWQVSDPGNVGTLLRTADAFDAGVALSPECADPTGPRALRASAGAIFRVPLVEWADIPDRKVALVAHGGEPLAAVDLTPPLAFVLGSEREGLPESLVGKCHKASIPTPGDAESLNVAAAGAIALYELSRALPDVRASRSLRRLRRRLRRLRPRSLRRSHREPEFGGASALPNPDARSPIERLVGPEPRSPHDEIQ